MKERQLIGKGTEHLVFTHPSYSKWVIKKPRTHKIAIMKLFGLEAKDVANQIEESAKLTEGENVEIPPTRIFIHSLPPDKRPFFFSFVHQQFHKQRYILAQRIYEQDASISLPEVAERINNPTLKASFLLNPRNFAVTHEKIYWLDPTQGIRTLFLDQFGLVNWKDYPIIKYQYRQKFSHFPKFILNNPIFDGVYILTHIINQKRRSF